MRDYTAAYDPTTGEIHAIWPGTRFRAYDTARTHQIKLHSVAEGHERTRAERAIAQILSLRTR